MSIGLVDLTEQYRSLQEEITAQIQQVLSEMTLFLGENVFRLEEEFARYCGTRYAVGVGSGTDALHLALRAGGVGPGDQVITVSLTFISTVEAIAHAGAQPVFVDIDPQTYTMDTSRLEAAITPKTKAIVPVQLYGHPADMDPVKALSDKHNLLVVEDACQAHGAEYKDAKVGSLGHAAAFSFYYTKNLGAYGEGGMVVTNNPKIATKVRMLRNHGAKAKHQYAFLGFNSRLDELQAAILRVKLPHLDRWNTTRRTWAREYNRQLADLEEVTTPEEQPYAKHVYHLYVIRVPRRDALARWLKAHGVATAIHYPVPVHIQKACEIFGYSPGSLPVSESISQQILSLPMYPELTLEQIGYVCQTIRDYFRRNRRGRKPARGWLKPSLSHQRKVES